MTRRLLLLTRRTLLGGAAAIASAAARAKPPRRVRVVTILGDSITAGFGLAYRDSLPAQLQAELTRRGANVRVRGAGISGDTTAGGLARVDVSVRGDTDLAVVALGGNDLLQGIAPASVQRNLTGIARRLKARRIRVLLVGILAPAVVKQTYARSFNAAFIAASRAEGVPFYPDLLGAVAGVESLNQADRIHPNARGVRLIAQRLAPSIVRILGP